MKKNSNGTQCGLSKQKLVANDDSKKCFAIKNFFRHFCDLSDSGFISVVFVMLKINVSELCHFRQCNRFRYQNSTQIFLKQFYTGFLPNTL